MKVPTGLLDRWSDERGDQLAFTFLERGEREAASLTFSELRRHALAVAHRLLEGDLGGQPVLLVFPPGLNFIVAFFGCLYAGAIAVPAPYLFPGRKAERIAAIVNDAGCRAVLSNAGFAGDDAAIASGVFNDADWIAVDRLSSTEEPVPNSRHPDANDVALLQYTSGSTGDPRGVMLTHANLMANQAMIAAAFQHGPDASLVSWLPMYHDMGLIGGVLQPVSIGRPAVLMSPLAFLQKPVRWLRAISKYRATTSGAPNFAYGLCARMVSNDQAKNLDLSSWQVAFCGAEPVRATDMEAFAAAFAGAGLNAGALFPCYGLAEATLFVSGGPKGSGLRQSTMGSRTVVASGTTLSDETVAIVDPERAEAVRPGEIGEIWVRGPHVGNGYWNNDAATRSTFGATIAGASDRYLRTGDLGYLENSQLYITGRLKDVLIVRGVKHHPEAVEETALRLIASPAVSPAAAAIEQSDPPTVIVLIEVGRGFNASHDVDFIAESVSAGIANEHGFKPRVVFVGLGTLPRTTSGKIQRGRCRELFQATGFAGRLIVAQETG